MILLGSGWSVAKVAEALLIDANTVRTYFRRYRQGVVWRNCYKCTGLAEPLFSRRSRNRNSMNISKGISTGRRNRWPTTFAGALEGSV
ncbi:MAG: terminase gpP N-terminus-related DNA-binding protein [Methylococcales bacterium]